MNMQDNVGSWSEYSLQVLIICLVSFVVIAVIILLGTLLVWGIVPDSITAAPEPAKTCDIAHHCA